MFFKYILKSSIKFLSFWERNTFEGDILDITCNQDNISKTLKELLPNFNIASANSLDSKYTRTFDTVIATTPLTIEKCLEISERYLIILSDVKLLERKDMFLNTPFRYIYIDTNTKATWFVLEKGYKGEPIIRWI